MEDKARGPVRVFNILNDETVAQNPSDLIFRNNGIEYFVERMDGDDLVAQPCTPDGEPDLSFPRFKADKSSFIAEGFRVKSNTSHNK